MALWEHTEAWTNGCQFGGDFSKRILMNEKLCMLIQISPKFVCRGPLTKLALAQVLDWLGTERQTVAGPNDDPVHTGEYASKLGWALTSKETS